MTVQCILHIGVVILSHFYSNLSLTSIFHSNFTFDCSFQSGEIQVNGEVF